MLYVVGSMSNFLCFIFLSIIILILIMYFDHVYSLLFVSGCLYMHTPLCVLRRKKGKLCWIMKVVGCASLAPAI